MTDTVGTDQGFSWDLVAGRIKLPTSSSNGATAIVRVVLTDKDGGDHPVAVSPTGPDLEFEVPPVGKPFSSAAIVDTQSGVTLDVLTDLFPESDHEFEERFKSSRDRYNDPRIDFFIGMQTFQMFSGSTGYRISSAVVCAYKAVELLDNEYLMIAEKQLLESLVLLPMTKVERSTRKNRDHLHVSLLCALWHVHLASGRERDFIETLFSLRALVEERSFHSFFNPSFNISLSLRALTLLHKLADDGAAAELISGLSFDVFKLGAAHSDKNMNHFKELGYVHNHVYQTMRLARRTRELPDSLASKSFHASLRVPVEKFPDSVARMEATFLRAAGILRNVDSGG